MIEAILIIGGGVLIFLVLTIGGWLLGTYNLFANKTQDIKNQWSNILTEYQRRADLFYNLTQAVKSYAKFEKETMTAVIQARSGNFGTGMLQQLKSVKKLDDSFSNILSKLAVVVEKYPELHAIEQYDKLTREIQNTEDRINIARTDYNGVVREYNGAVVTFPNKILAKWWGFKENEYYVNQKESEKDYKIKLD